MPQKNFKTNSYCPNHRHYSKTIGIEGDVTKTGQKMLTGSCVECIGKQSLFVSDNSIQAKGIGNFFKDVRKNSASVGKKLAKVVFKNLASALEIGAKIGNAAVSFFSVLHVTIFYHTGKR